MQDLYRVFNHRLNTPQNILTGDIYNKNINNNRVIAPIQSVVELSLSFMVIESIFYNTYCSSSRPMCSTINWTWTHFQSVNNKNLAPDATTGCDVGDFAPWIVTCTHVANAEIIDIRFQHRLIRCKYSTAAMRSDRGLNRCL